MAKFLIKESCGKIYIPKEMREIISNNKKCKAIANFQTALLINPNASYDDALKSLKVIEADLKHRAEAEKNENKD